MSNETGKQTIVISMSIPKEDKVYMDALIPFNRSKLMLEMTKVLKTLYRSQDKRGVDLMQSIDLVRQLAEKEFQAPPRPSKKS